MIEEHIASGTDGTVEQQKPDDSVTGKRTFADPGGDGKEKEATTRSPTAGASSDAAPESGIPSAVKQQGKRTEATAHQDETPMANHAIPTKQNTKP